MKQAVIDTNVLVAAGINPSGTPAKVLAAVESLELQPVLSAEVISEYRDVLTRAHFGFKTEWISRLFDNFEALGLLLDPAPVNSASLPDPSDAPFIALARHAGCLVITGNAKHFPASAGVVVMTPAEWVVQQAERDSADSA
ncbi:MAG: PIN domain-containing protein [Panacagrimonas sp.]